MDKIFGNFVAGRGAVGLLIVRFVFGLGLILHGLPKLQRPGGAFGWMGPDAPVPGILQALAVLSEVGGGLALILGLLTPLAALGVICTMAYAVIKVHMAAGDPFVSSGGRSYESAAGYLAVGLLMLLTGPGALSLDALLFGRGQRAATEPVSND